MYYSQLGQDEFIDNFFFQKENGVFIDIGANDGVKLSNTFFFEKERKWSGICIEPLPIEFEELKNNRTSINLNVAVSDFNGYADFTYVEGYANMLSGISDYYKKEYHHYISESVKNNGDKIHNIKVPVRKLQDIFDEYNIIDIDFCSIDTEGSEYNIIKSIDFDKTNIKILIVENNFGEEDVKKFLESKGYVLFKKMSQDDFYIKKNKQLEINLIDSNFGHQESLNPHHISEKILWKRDGVRQKINVYTDNFIKSEIINIPQDDNYNICILLEPLTNPAWTDIYEYIQTDFEKFDLIITHNLGKLGYLIDSRPDKFYYSTKCATTSWLPKEVYGLHHKTKKISMAFSDKNFAEGHRLRHIIYEKYKNSGLIDFYGSGTGEYLNDLRDCYIDYKYVIVCENTLQKGYNSEKLNDILLNGCIPIYWGTEILDKNYDLNSIFRFAPNMEIVNFEFEESLNNLEHILDYIVNNDPYDSLIESVKHNYEYSLKFCNSEDNIYEILLQKNIIKL